MPHKVFLQDIADAAISGRFSCLSDIKTGDYEESISFIFTAPGASLTLDLQAIVSGKEYNSS
jgi:ubiquitin-conjugating enzyme E2 Q